MKSISQQVFAQYPIESRTGDGVWLQARDGRKSWTFMAGGPRGCGNGLRPSTVAGRSLRPGAAEAFQTHALHVGRPREGGGAPGENSWDSGWTPCFGSTAAPEANENALKLAFKITGAAKPWGGTGWHGRTAAAGAVTWGALGKWYGFHAPVRRGLRARDNPAAVETVRGHRHRRSHRGTGAGRWRRLRCRKADAWRPASTLRRCRSPADLRRSAMRHGPDGSPFRGELLRRDTRHPHGGQGAGQRIPVSALLMSRRVAIRSNTTTMGTRSARTHGLCGREAVIDTIESESLLATSVRSRPTSGRLAPRSRDRDPGRGFLLGLKTRVPARKCRPR